MIGNPFEPGSNRPAQSAHTVSVPAPVTDDLPAAVDRHRPLARGKPPAGVPRRYTLRTILAVTTGLAVLLTFLKWLNVYPVVIACLVGYLVLVGLGQALLFHGKRPRLASIVVGAVIVICLFVVVAALSGQFSFALSAMAGGYGSAIGTLLSVCFIIFLWALLGALLGYAGGGIVAGVFLIMDYVEKILGRKNN